MLASSVARILERLDDDALVLDVGGWARPFTRADVVLDLLPYESRGMLGRDGEGEERFTRETWLQRDVCAREPWPFSDRQFDFAVCSQTLEDLRDPVWVCGELVRVAKGGYIEVPSRLEEQSYGVHGPWVGWSHHRWLVDVGPASIEFVFKHHVLHSRASDHFPPGFHATLTEEERVRQLWWGGGFDYRERVMTSAEELDPYLAGFVARELRERGLRPRRRRSALARLLRR